MQKVPAWSATDGRVFTDRAVCKAHDACLALVDLVASAKIDDGACEDDPGVTVARHLIAHRDDVLALLRKAEEAPTP